MLVNLDAPDAVELGEMLAFLGDWLASDPHRLQRSLEEFIAAHDTTGPPDTLEQLRVDLHRFAQLLLGYNTVNGSMD